jgi:hypothetical protein
MSRRFEVGDVVRILDSKCVIFVENNLYTITGVNLGGVDKYISLNRIDIDNCQCVYCQFYYTGGNILQVTRQLQLIEPRIKIERTKKLKELLNNV